MEGCSPRRMGCSKGVIHCSKHEHHLQFFLKCKKGIRFSKVGALQVSKILKNQKKEYTHSNLKRVLSIKS